MYLTTMMSHRVVTTTSPHLPPSAFLAQAAANAAAAAAAAAAGSEPGEEGSATPSVTASRMSLRRASLGGRRSSVSAADAKPVRGVVGPIDFRAELAKVWQGL